MPVPAVTVTAELARSALATEASTILVELTEAVVIRPVARSILNVAEAVEIPPTSKSSVIFKGETAPEFLCQLELPPPLAAAQEDSTGDGQDLAA